MQVKALLAKAALEEEAREAAKKKQAEVEAKLREREEHEQERGRKLGGRSPQAPDPEQAHPEPKAQLNFTGPHSRIMKHGAAKEFVQAYNAQAADRDAQVSVAMSVTQEANDRQQFGLYPRCRPYRRPLRFERQFLIQVPFRKMEIQFHDEKPGAISKRISRQ